MSQEIRLHRPTIVLHGPTAIHDQCCAVHHKESAVLNLDDGVFHPSWKAQQEGWRLVKSKSRFQCWLLKTFFGDL